eukprot:TRINITY_DN12509_c0_g2_i1.p1 TRINITY_DN12509_c0_g2~~TRINITY_DN12509_c0_g2_i1.p1  ORF type:complete len:633 (-),score=118.28 TRINITY_DN12509_c0_g2_i1:250-2148(-)
MPVPIHVSASCPVVTAPGESLAELLGELQQLKTRSSRSTEEVKVLELRQRASETSTSKLQQHTQQMASALDKVTERVEGMLLQLRGDLQEETATLQIHPSTWTRDTPAMSSLETPLSNSFGTSNLMSRKADSHGSLEPSVLSGGIVGSEAGLNMTGFTRFPTVDRLQPTVRQKSLIDELMKTEEEPLPSASSGMLPFLREVSRRIVRSRCFEYSICVIIAINSIALGVETELSISKPEYSAAWAEYMEIFFMCVYLFEAVLRFASDGMQCFCDAWFLFDFGLIIASVVRSLLSLTPLRSQSDGSSEVWPVWQQVMILRTFRLLRLVRALRMIKQLRSIWRLVYGLMMGCTTIVSTLTLVMLVTYVFSVLGLEVITKDLSLSRDPVTAQIVEHQFSSLFVTMMTLMQFVTLDSAAAFYAPLIMVKPSLAIYFSALVVIVSISLMNLVTAVLVEGALEHARQDKEEESRLVDSIVRAAVPHIVSIFDRIDADGSGTIALDEIVHLPLQMIPSELLDKASVHSMKELFEMLDVDCTGELTRDEFTEGLLSIFLLDVPLYQMQQIRMLRLLRSEVSIVQHALGVVTHEGAHDIHSFSKESATRNALGEELARASPKDLIGDGDSARSDSLIESLCA